TGPSSSTAPRPSAASSTTSASSSPAPRPTSRSRCASTSWTSSTRARRSSSTSRSTSPGPGATRRGSPSARAPPSTRPSARSRTRATSPSPTPSGGEAGLTADRRRPHSGPTVAAAGGHQTKERAGPPHPARSRFAPASGPAGSAAEPVRQLEGEHVVRPRVDEAAERVAGSEGAEGLDVLALLRPHEVERRAGVVLPAEDGVAAEGGEAEVGPAHLERLGGAVAVGVHREHAALLPDDGVGVEVVRARLGELLVAVVGAGGDQRLGE